MNRFAAVLAGVLILSNAAFASLGKFDNLIVETKNAQENLNKLNDKIGAQEKDLEDIKERLKAAKVLSTTVDDLQSKLKTLSKVVKIVSALPKIRKPMKLLKERIDKAEEKLKDVNNPLRKAEKKIKPVRTAIVQTIKTRDTLAKNIIKFSKAVDESFYPGAEKVKASHTAGMCKNLEICEKDLEDLSSAALPVMSAMSVSADEAVKNMEKAQAKGEDIANALKPLKKVGDEIEGLSNVLDKLDKSLEKVQQLLKQDIEISFHYPAPKLGDLDHKAKASIKIEIGDILEGPGKIQDMMEKKMGKAAWKLAKAAGVKDIIEDFKNKADKKVDNMLDDLHLDFEPEIKGMDEIMDLAGNVKENCAEMVDNLNLPEFDFAALDGVQKHINNHEGVDGLKIGKGNISLDMSETDFNEEKAVEILNRLKSSYEQQDKDAVLSLFSKQFPDYGRFSQSMQDDFQNYKNINLFFRINSVTLSQDKNSAVINVFVEKRFMMQQGNSYNDNSTMDIKLIKENGQWAIDGMSNNTLFGSALTHMANIQVDPASIVVSVSGVPTTPVIPPAASNITMQVNAVVGNKGTADTESFNVQFVYTHANGQIYNGTAVISMLKKGLQVPVTYTFSGLVAAPAAGDSLKITADPEHKIPEIKVDDNTVTKAYPF